VTLAIEGWPDLPIAGWRCTALTTLEAGSIVEVLRQTSKGRTVERPRSWKPGWRWKRTLRSVLPPPRSADQIN